MKLMLLFMAVLLCAASFATDSADAQQQAKVYRVGWLGQGAADVPSLFFDALRIGMREVGQIEGQTYVFEQQWWSGRGEELPALVESLVRAKVDIIVAQGAAVHGVKSITQMPVVFVLSGDPVLAGFVHSLARPGGNMTGNHPGEPLEIAESQSAAQRLGLSIQYVQARTGTEIDMALAALREARAEAIVVLPDGLTMQYCARIIEFADRTRIPMISGWSAFAHSGGLMTYDPNLRDSWRRVATYVDKVLKGAKPGVVPVEQLTKFELVINLKTATALGLTIPPLLLARADEVIE